MENVPDGQGYEAWRRPLHAYGNSYSAETLFRKATVFNFGWHSCHACFVSCLARCKTFLQHMNRGCTEKDQWTTSHTTIQPRQQHHAAPHTTHTPHRTHNTRTHMLTNAARRECDYSMHVLVPCNFCHNVGSFSYSRATSCAMLSLLASSWCASSDFASSVPVSFFTVTSLSMSSFLALSFHLLFAPFMLSHLFHPLRVVFPHLVAELCFFLLPSWPIYHHVKSSKFHLFHQTSRTFIIRYALRQ